VFDSLATAVIGEVGGKAIDFIVSVKQERNTYHRKPTEIRGRQRNIVDPNGIFKAVPHDLSAITSLHQNTSDREK
jgi:hypothetical protein